MGERWLGRASERPPAGPNPKSNNEVQSNYIFKYAKGSLSKFGWDGNLRINFVHSGTTDSKGNLLPVNRSVRNAAGSVQVGVIGNFGVGFSVGGTTEADGSMTHDHITPLKTTRAQVEKVLGKPMPHSVNPHAASYETDAGRVSVLYSSGSCTSQDKSGWDVPELTIIDIKFYPKSPPDFAGLKIDLKNFEKSAQPGSIGIDEYSNYRDGIAITVDTDEGTATSFRYFPNQRDKSRICKN